MGDSRTGIASAEHLAPLEPIAHAVKPLPRPALHGLRGCEGEEKSLRCSMSIYTVQYYPLPNHIVVLRRRELPDIGFFKERYAFFARQYLHNLVNNFLRDFLLFQILP